MRESEFGEVQYQATAKMIRFIEENHTYWKNDKRLPSVSELLGIILGKGYEGIPAYILNQAAEFGTLVHTAIELYFSTGILRDDLSPYADFCLNECIRITKDIKPLELELVTSYKDFYAGTIDLVAENKDGLTLIDYKTTAEKHLERWKWQLNLYRLAYEESTGEKVKSLKVAHIPKKSKGEMVEIETINDHLLIDAVMKAIGEINEQ